MILLGQSFQTPLTRVWTCRLLFHCIFVVILFLCQPFEVVLKTANNSQSLHKVWPKFDFVLQNLMSCWTHYVWPKKVAVIWKMKNSLANHFLSYVDESALFWCWKPDFSNENILFYLVWDAKIQADNDQFCHMYVWSNGNLIRHMSFQEERCICKFLSVLICAWH